MNLDKILISNELNDYIPHAKDDPAFLLAKEALLNIQESSHPSKYLPNMIIVDGNNISNDTTMSDIVYLGNLKSLGFQAIGVASEWNAYAENIRTYGIDQVGIRDAFEQLLFVIRKYNLADDNGSHPKPL